MNPARLTTGQIYRDFNQIIKRVEGWIAKKNLRILGCDTTQVKARIVQRIVELSYGDYARKAINAVERPSPLSSHPPRVIDAGGLQICTTTGKISVSVRQWTKHIILFAASWLHFLILFLGTLFKKSPQHSSAATLLMEAGGGYEESDSRFVKFCREGPIESLSSARHIIVKSRQQPRNSTDPSFIYTPHPLIYLANNLLQRSVRFFLLFRHLTAPFYYLQALIACPVNVLISHDLSFIPAVQLLDKKNLIEAIVITTSSFASQPLWMKGLTNQRFKLHMIWYSQNFIPKMYIGEEKRSNLPPARHMRVDVHWVWTEGFKTYLRELGQTSDIRVVGPILWYLPEPITGLGDTYIKIAIFDITPLPDGKTAHGAAKNYYSVTTVKKYITDVVDLCDEIVAVSGKQVLVVLKHKRPPKVDYHDSLYLEFLEQMAVVKPNFKLIDHQTNLFGLLKECHLSVSMPYTSTTHVAASVRKPAIYYDPFAELVPQYEKNGFVHFASGPGELKQLTAKLLNISQHVSAS